MSFAWDYIVINLTKQKSYGRIVTNKSVNESFELAKNICKDLKLKIKDIDESKHIIHGKTKTSFVQNKFGETFFVLVKPTSSNSVIEIYYNGAGMTGTDAGPLIQPFYKKFMEKTGTSPDLDSYLIEINDDEIKESANDTIVIEGDVIPQDSLPQGIDTTSKEDSISETSNQQTFVSSPSNPSVSTSSSSIMTVGQLKQLISMKHDQFKAQWEKNGIVQFKNEHVAILQRMWGSQVQFIIAYDQLTKEGYRLMSIDEGKSGGQASGGFTGGVNAYFYFQNMKYVSSGSS